MQAARAAHDLTFWLGTGIENAGGYFLMIVFLRSRAQPAGPAQQSVFAEVAKALGTDEAVEGDSVLRGSQRGGAGTENHGS